MGCDAIQEQLTALADHELGSWQRWRVERHLKACRNCTAEAAALAAATRRHPVLLSKALAVEGLDVEAMRRKARLAIAAAPESEPTWAWPTLLRPAWALAVILLIGAAGLALRGQAANSFLAALGLVSPPSAVASKPEMFHDYWMIRNLDALENFDDVNAVPLEDDQTSSIETTRMG